MTNHLLKITSLVLCLIGSAMAQPVLTASGINPQLNNTFTLNNVPYTNPGSAGNNQTWNFAAWTSTSSTNLTVQTVTSAPNPSPFISSSNMQMNDGASFQFWNAGSSVLALTGIDVPLAPLTMAYSNSEEIMHYPFSMNNTYSDTWATTYTYSPYTFTRTGTTNVTYDGYGTLITPMGTFSNVARIQLVQNFTDAFSLGSFTTTNTQYVWYANGYHQPLVSMSSAISGTDTSQEAWYLTANPGSVATGVFENINSNVVQSFPNPAINKVSFTSNQYPVTKVELFNLNGQLILSEENTQGSSVFSVDVSSLSAGVYMSKIYGNTGLIETKKVSIQK